MKQLIKIVFSTLMFIGVSLHANFAGLHLWGLTEHVASVLNLIYNSVGNTTDNTIEVIDSKVDICCTQLSNNLDYIRSRLDNPSGPCDLTPVESNLESLASSLDTCCTTMNSQTDLLISAIDECGSGGTNCSPTPLTTAGTLSTKGAIYCLTQDITGAFIINASDITLNLNGHTLTGIITVNSTAPYATITNGYITPPAPASTTDAATAAITIGADSCTVSNCTIMCADSIGQDVSLNGLNGRTAIAGSGTRSHITITGCALYAGAGTDGSFSSTITGNGGNGGNGIDSLGLYATILQCTILSGNGGTGSSSTFLTQKQNGGTGGASGHGITNFSSYAFIKSCSIITGNGGNGGKGNDYFIGGDGGTGGTSGSAIISSGLSNATIEKCLCITGTAGNGGIGGSRAATGSSAGAGGAGGNSGSAIAYSTIAHSCIKNCTLKPGSGGNGGNSGTDAIPVPPGGNGGTAGSGIVIQTSANDVAIQECIIKTGSGGTGGNGGNGDPSSSFNAAGGNGGNGGNAGNGVTIALSGTTKNNIRECTIQLLGSGGNGGNGGQGGTNNGNGGNAGNGGNGSNGIYFTDTTSTTEVRLCTIKNGSVGGTNGTVGAPMGSGTPGNPGLPGTAGRAIEYGTIPLSFTDMIAQNFAHHIVSSPAYRICNKGLGAVDNGTSVYTSTGVYDNVYQ